MSATGGAKRKIKAKPHSGPCACGRRTRHQEQGTHGIVWKCRDCRAMKVLDAIPRAIRQVPQQAPRQ